MRVALGEFLHDPRRDSWLARAKRTGARLSGAARARDVRRLEGRGRNSMKSLSSAYTVSLNGVASKYVGITTRGIAKRWLDHQASGSSKKSSRLVGKRARSRNLTALKTSPSITFCILMGRGRPFSSLRSFSCAKHSGTLFPAGYNLTAGGGSHFVVSNKTRAKMSAARVGMKFTAAHLAAMSAANMGHSHTEATRAKMSGTRTGRKHSAEWKVKQRISAIKRGISAETRAKIAATKDSPEYRAKHGANKEKIAAHKAAYRAANMAVRRASRGLLPRE